MMENTSKHLVKSYVAVLALTAALYVVSCAPGTLWQDSGMYLYRIWNNDIEGKLGLASARPLYHIMAIGIKYIPIGEFAYRISLISAISAAITVANVFLLLRLWLGRNLTAAIAAITLAVSWTFWRHASIAEVYTLYTALFTAELIFLLQYFKSNRTGYLYLLGLFNGLAIANHMFAVIALICYSVFLAVLLLQKQISLKSFGIVVALWIIGAAPYEYLIVKSIITTGSFTTTLASAFFGNSWRGAVLNTFLSTRIIKENLIFIAYSFPTPNILFLFTGIASLYKISSDKRFAHIMLALSILFFVFAFRYTVPDRYAFFMPFYCLASVFIGAGIHLFLERYPRKLYVILIVVFAFLALPVYEIVPTVAQRLKVDLGTKRTIPYRNEYKHFLQPWQTTNHSPELFAGEALKCVESDAIIIADGTTVYPLWYLQKVKGINVEAKVVSIHGSYKNPIEFPTVDTIGTLMADSTVYVVSPVEGYCPDFLLERYDFVETGPIYRVVDRQ